MFEASRYIELIGGIQLASRPGIRFISDEGRRSQVNSTMIGEVMSAEYSKVNDIVPPWHLHSSPALRQDRPPITAPTQIIPTPAQEGR